MLDRVAGHERESTTAGRARRTRPPRRRSGTAGSCRAARRPAPPRGSRASAAGSHSPASGPTAVAPTTHAASRVGHELEEALRASAARRSRRARCSAHFDGHEPVALDPADRRDLRVGEGRRAGSRGSRRARRRPAMSAAATRAWYLPTCVNSATPVTSPIAQTFSAARSRSSTSTPLPRDLDAELLETEPVDVSARRPVATSSRSAVDRRRRPARWTRISRARRARPLRARVEARSPPRANAPASSAPASASIARQEPRRCGRRSSPARRAAVELRELAADGAAAEDDEARGHLARRAVASRLVQYSTVVEPVDRRDRRRRAGRDDEPLVLELARRRPRRRRAGRPAPRPRTSSTCDPRATRRGPSRRSRRRPGRATQKTCPGSSSPVTASAAPGARRAAATSLGRAQQRLRRHAGVVRALAADELALDERRSRPPRRAGAAPRRTPRRRRRRRARRPGRSRHASRAVRKPAKIWRRIGKSQLRNVLRTAAGCVAHEPPRSTLYSGPKKTSEYSRYGKARKPG